MNDLTPYPLGDGKPPKPAVDDFTSKILIPFGAVLIAAIVFLSSSNKLPLWATVAVIAYLVIMIVWVLARPVKNLVSRMVTLFGRKRFASKMRPQLIDLVGELNGLLNRHMVNTFPYLISNFASRLSEKVRFLLRLDRNLREFDVIQSWALALRDRCSADGTSGFWANAADFTLLVLRFSWACTLIKHDALT